MWHETSTEMIEMIKSIFRMDNDSAARSLAKKMFTKSNDPDYYEWETHIFFDDAMEREYIVDDDGKKIDYKIIDGTKIYNDVVCNQYVKNFVAKMDEQGRYLLIVK